ncbi:hypothetical protein [Thiorhodococcus drewsii]|uniref:hypothetical protein n=1 Tax=Thiorhodococcus drewsii TaxID=210408 RepID=UPI001FE07E15|nr:hypothetical protein [Thiorhodococcus drewsii]
MTTLIALRAEHNHRRVIEQRQVTQVDFLTQTVIVIDWLVAPVTLGSFQGAVNINLERLALGEHNPVNGDIRQVQQRLEGFCVKHHYQRRSNEIS